MQPIPGSGAAMHGAFLIEGWLPANHRSPIAQARFKGCLPNHPEYTVVVSLSAPDSERPRCPLGTGPAPWARVRVLYGHRQSSRQAMHFDVACLPPEALWKPKGWVGWIHERPNAPTV